MGNPVIKKMTNFLIKSDVKASSLDDEATLSYLFLLSLKHSCNQTRSQKLFKEMKEKENTSNDN